MPLTETKPVNSSDVCSQGATYNSPYDTAQSIYRRLTARSVFILDWDGSTVPLADDHRCSVAPEATVNILNMLAQKVRVGANSGRSVDQLKKFLGDQARVDFLSGSHGLELWDAREKSSIQKVPHEVVEAMQSFATIFRGVLKNHGVSDSDADYIVESKPASVAAHWRLYSNDTSKIALIRGCFEEAKVAFTKDSAKLFKSFEGSQCLELKYGGSSKAEGAIRLVQHLNPDFVVVVGDDNSDLDVAKKLKSAQVDYFGVAVSSFLPVVEPFFHARLESTDGLVKMLYELTIL